MKNKGDAIIEVRNLKKSYKMGEVVNHVLKGIDMEVYRGEFVGIMGPSGSGKSTTLHQLGLLDEPDSGTIIIDGTSVLDLDEREKTFFRLFKLGYVFQEYRNIPELNALENVYLPLKMAGAPKDEYIKRALFLLDKVGLKHKAYSHPYELSGGEQQRVAIARALINKPIILFADEPTASLDTLAGRRVLDLFKYFNKEFGQTIVMVTHEPEHVRYFDRVFRIRDGIIEKIEVVSKK